MPNMKQIGKDIVKEIRKEIIRLGLVDLGDYLASVGFRVEGNTIVLFSDVPYAEALEFGTFDFGAVSSSASPGWPSSQAKSLKKKDLTAKQRAALPSGMVAFSPMRRVIYNDRLIKGIIRKNT